MMVMTLSTILSIGFLCSSGRKFSKFVIAQLGVGISILTPSLGATKLCKMVDVCTPYTKQDSINRAAKLAISRFSYQTPDYGLFHGSVYSIPLIGPDISVRKVIFYAPRGIKQVHI